jgi:threonine dehydrogenase-like Zn-dependent dehydrogenase
MDAYSGYDHFIARGDAAGRSTTLGSVRAPSSCALALALRTSREYTERLHRVAARPDCGPLLPRAINVMEEKLRDVIRGPGMTEGFDVDLEMSGVPSAFTSMREAMNHGGKIALLGIPPAHTAVDRNQVIFKGLEIKGIYGREMFETWYKMVAMLKSGLVIPRF